MLTLGGYNNYPVNGSPNPGPVRVRESAVSPREDWPRLLEHVILCSKCQSGEGPAQDLTEFRQGHTQ